MSEREESLADLIHLRRNLGEVQRDLNKFPWDLEKPMMIISKADFSAVLKKSVDGEISFKDLESWTNAIIQRDDIGFETDALQAAFFELANPEINGAISQERIQAILKEME